MPLQVTSGAASYDAFGGGVPIPPNYIENVFSSTLYTGNGSAQTITTGIDLSTYGGLLWIKNRSSATNGHCLIGPYSSYSLSSESTAAESGPIIPTYMTAITTTGFSVGTNNDGGFIGAGFGSNDKKFVAWSFRKQPKFFDVVTYTGTGANRTIAHNLGSVPGCIIVKKTSGIGAWRTYHRSTGATNYLELNSTIASSTGATLWNNTAPTSTVFSLGTNTGVNDVGQTFIAYLFAHDAGGFGLTGTDNVISCGSVNIDATGYFDHNLGWEPQFLLWKKASAAEGWYVYNTMSGMPHSGATSVLQPNLIDAEGGTASAIVPTATGFKNLSTGTGSGASSTYIYIAIRRGPMKVPTSGASVFAPVAYTGTNVDNRLVNTGIVTDMTMARIRTTTSTGSFYTADRLRGNSSLGTAITDAENTDADSFMTPTVGYGNSFSAMDGFGVGNDITRQLNQASTSQLAYAFRRSPRFFDEVCYTGTGNGATQITHNLQVIPELVICKSRSSAINWSVACNVGGMNYVRGLASAFGFNSTNAATQTVDFTGAISSTYFKPTTIYGAADDANQSGVNYVAYLFATCAGVSKVGSYTGNGGSAGIAGTAQTINCGFSGGSRFVLIKCTSNTGEWFVFDSARGIVAGNDPYLQLQSSAVELTGSDAVDTDSTGFIVNQIAATDLNVTGRTYIFLAIA